MSVSMQRIIRRTMRPAAGTLVVAFALLVPLTCATGRPMTQVEEACCAAMGQECPPVAQQDCCSVQAATQVAQFAPAAKVVLNAPTALASPSAIVPPLAVISAAVRFRAVDDFQHRPGSTRTYLLVSALLI